MSYWMRPVNAPMNQAFGHDSGQGPHPGTDYACPMGTPILAPSDGVVIFAGYADGFGWHTVALYHPADNVSSTYGHMEAHYVGVGQVVRAGAMLGLADTQGWSTGPHLHYEMRVGDAPFGGFARNFDGDVWLHNHGAYGQSPLQPAGPLTPAQRVLIKNLQVILHVAVDGAWGKQTDDALELIRFFCLNKGTHNTQVALLQQLWGVTADGDWGPKTDQAYLFWRFCFYNK